MDGVTTSLVQLARGMRPQNCTGLDKDWQERKANMAVMPHTMSTHVQHHGNRDESSYSKRRERSIAHQLEITVFRCWSVAATVQQE